jgi:hypothetical protein
MPSSKKSGKQFRHSLKTKEQKLAHRRLKEPKGQIGCLTLTDDAKLGFEAAANRMAIHTTMKTFAGQCQPH